MVVGIRTRQHHDPMGKVRRRRTWLRRTSLILFFIALTAGGVWIFFGSTMFAVADIRVSGADRTGNDVVIQSIRELLSERALYIFKPQRNMLLLDGSAVADHIIGVYAAIGSVTVTKKYPHLLEVAVTERTPIGTWCRKDTCQSFDERGVRWGEAVKSSGPLLLLITDERTDDVRDDKMFQGIMTAVRGLPELGLTAKSVTLPDAEPGGIRIPTSKGYSLSLDALGDVEDQLATLKIFLADRAKDAAFAPQYIDLRTPGRIYYK